MSSVKEKSKVQQVQDVVVVDKNAEDEGEFETSFMHIQKLEVCIFEIYDGKIHFIHFFLFRVVVYKHRILKNCKKMVTIQLKRLPILHVKRWKKSKELVSKKPKKFL